MVTVAYDPAFLKTIGKIKDANTKQRVKNHIIKLITNPEIGKPMRYGRKGTREVYIPPYRIAYAYLPDEDTIIMLGLYHKDEQ